MYTSSICAFENQHLGKNDSDPKRSRSMPFYDVSIAQPTSQRVYPTFKNKTSEVLISSYKRMVIASLNVITQDYPPPGYVASIALKECFLSFAICLLASSILQTIEDKETFCLLSSLHNTSAVGRHVM